MSTWLLTKLYSHRIWTLLYLTIIAQSIALTGTVSMSG